MLGRSEIDQFVERGFVRVAEAIPSAVARACCELACRQLDIPAEGPWPQPVVRGMADGEPFLRAATARRLVEAVGQLLDGEAWQRRPNLGLIVARFPSDTDPGDCGWHIDAGFEGPATDSLFNWYVNARSRGRGLLLLCLLSDVGVDDAPTRILDGSHRLVPPLLRPFGEDGVVGLHAPLPAPDGPVSLATGQAGDVFLCHPFLVHAATWPHRGASPRLIAQPPISLDGALRIDAPAGERSVVADIVHRALAR